jgi:hypothetical protein
MADPGFEYENAESLFVPMDCEMGWLIGLKPAAAEEQQPVLATKGTHRDGGMAAA